MAKVEIDITEEITKEISKQVAIELEHHGILHFVRERVKSIFNESGHIKRIKSLETKVSILERKLKTQFHGGKN